MDKETLTKEHEYLRKSQKNPHSCIMVQVDIYDEIISERDTYKKKLAKLQAEFNILLELHAEDGQVTKKAVLEYIRREILKGDKHE